MRFPFSNASAAAWGSACVLLDISQQEACHVGKILEYTHSENLDGKIRGNLAIIFRVFRKCFLVSYHTPYLKRTRTCVSEGGMKWSKVAAFGANDAGQCTAPALPARAVAGAAGTAHSLLLLEDGRAFAFGANNAGQCEARISPNQCLRVGTTPSDASALETWIRSWSEHTTPSSFSVVSLIRYLSRCFCIRCLVSPLFDSGKIESENACQKPCHVLRRRQSWVVKQSCGAECLQQP